MTLNGVMAVTLRYFSEVGQHALQKTICGGIYARVYCIFSACTMSSQRKFTFAISSPDEFLVLVEMWQVILILRSVRSRIDMRLILFHVVFFNDWFLIKLSNNCSCLFFFTKKTL